MFPHLSMCVFRPQLLLVLKYVIALLYFYSHEHSGSYWRFAGLIGQGKSGILTLCCLDSEKVVGIDDNSIVASCDS